MSLPTMAKHYVRASTTEWAKAIDAGPFSSISCGERITFHNPEMMVTMAAAAALTERVDVFVNLVVLPLHPVALIAKQLATLDNLNATRIDNADWALFGQATVELTSWLDVTGGVRYTEERKELDQVIRSATDPGAPRQIFSR